MRRFICAALILCFLSIPASALCLFTSDYDNDKWKVERIEYEPADTIPEGWCPLRAVSEHLPIDVSWDEEKREVVVFSHYLQQTFRYKADALPANIKIKDGVTYCSPKRLARFLWNKSFIYNGEVYYFAGESRKSRLIQPGESEVFKAITITTMYEIKLKLPEEYAFIRKHLTGGIAYTPKGEEPASVTGAFGYIRPGSKKPICYIVGDQKAVHFMANCIAHEAYHVWQYRNGKTVEEETAWAYGTKVQNALDEQ